MSATTAKYVTGQKVMLKSGQSATIVGIDSVGQTYKVMGADNQYKSVKPDEIDKMDTGKFTDYQASGPDLKNPDKLSIKTKDVAVDQK